MISEIRSQSFFSFPGLHATAQTLKELTQKLTYTSKLMLESLVLPEYHQKNRQPCESSKGRTWLIFCPSREIWRWPRSTLWAEEAAKNQNWWPRLLLNRPRLSGRYREEKLQQEGLILLLPTSHMKNTCLSYMYPQAPFSKCDLEKPRNHPVSSCFLFLFFYFSVHLSPKTCKVATKICPLCHILRILSLVHFLKWSWTTMYYYLKLQGI